MHSRFQVSAKMLFEVQLWSPVWPLNDFQIGFSKPLLCFLGDMLHLLEKLTFTQKLDPKHSETDFHSGLLSRFLYLSL